MIPLKAAFLKASHAAPDVIAHATVCYWSDDDTGFHTAQLLEYADRITAAAKEIRELSVSTETKTAA